MLHRRISELSDFAAKQIVLELRWRCLLGLLSPSLKEEASLVIVMRDRMVLCDNIVIVLRRWSVVKAAIVLVLPSRLAGLEGFLKCCELLIQALLEHVV